jgi:hypothetical protein
LKKNFLNNLKKSAVIALAILCFPSVTALADGNIPEDAAVKIGEDGNYIYEGGINKFRGTFCETRQDAQDLEQTLLGLNSVYVREGDAGSAISDEDVELLLSSKSTTFFFSEYLTADTDKTLYKVYLYKPSLTDALDQLRDGDFLSDTTMAELLASSVLINYSYYDSKERAGTTIYEFNDRLPADAAVGYIEILTPIDLDVTLLRENDGTYVNFAVQGGVPFYVKVRAGRYYVTGVNNLELSESTSYFEKSLKNNNIFYVGLNDTGMSIDDPCVIEFTDYIEKYAKTLEITDISGRADYNLNTDKSTYETKEIENESVAVSETKEEEVTDTMKQNRMIYVIICIALAVLAIAFAAFIRKRESKTF